MRRTLTVLSLVFLGVAGLVAQASPAAAAIEARRVLRCQGEPMCWPVAFDWTPSGRRLFYLERFSGEIRVKNLRTGVDTLWTTIPNVAAEVGRNQGALGLALDPGWATGPAQRWVYAYYTEEGSPDMVKIIRLRRNAVGFDQQELESYDAPEGTHHGGVLRFGPDGKLYAVTGDSEVPARSQDVNDPAGKVLRLNRDGSIPADNPFPGSSTFSFGHRNSFGLTFDPKTGRLWETENGPSCNDEVNLVVKGGNYAWGPTASCDSPLPPARDTNQDGPLPQRLPEVLYRDPIAVTGAAFCMRCGLGRRLRGDLIMGAFITRNIRSFQLSQDRRNVVGQRFLYKNDEWVLAVEAGPGRRIFFSDPSGIHRLAAT